MPWNGMPWHGMHGRPAFSEPTHQLQSQKNSCNNAQRKHFTVASTKAAAVGEEGRWLRMEIPRSKGQDSMTDQMREGKGEDSRTKLSVRGYSPRERIQKKNVNNEFYLGYVSNDCNSKKCRTQVVLRVTNHTTFWEWRQRDTEDGTTLNKGQAELLMLLKSISVPNHVREEGSPGGITGTKRRASLMPMTIDTPQAVQETVNKFQKDFLPFI